MQRCTRPTTGSASATGSVALSPAIALLHWSSALAGTDIAAHQHFALAAERQRQTLIRKINEDMMVNGARQGYDYLASAEFWRTVPDFVYRAPPAHARDSLGARRPAGAACVERTRNRGGVVRGAAANSDLSHPMNLRDMFLHEWRTRLARPAALVCLTAFAAILTFAAVSGRVERDARARAIAGHESQVADAIQRWLADLRARETRGEQSGVPPWSASPMDLEFPSSLPPAPLADFSIGQADLLPSAGKLSLWDPDVRLFSRYEFEDPASLALGALDLSKAIVLLLPLLMIVLSFDVLSAERDAGRLGLTLAQGADLRRLFWQRLSIRCGLVMIVALALAATALFSNGAGIRAVRQIARLRAVVRLRRALRRVLARDHRLCRERESRGESNIVRLLLCWTTFTLIVPAAVTAIAEATYPPPSRLAYLAQARRIEIETERAEGGIASSFFIDHPELVVDDASEMPAYLRTAFFVTSTVDDATRPVLDAFESTAARRDYALTLLRYVSPAIIAHGVFNDAAGTSAARHRRYMAQARAYKRAYAELAGPYIAAGRPLPSERVTAFPRFRYQDLPFSTVLVSAFPVLAFLMLVASALLLAANRRLRGGLQ